MNHLDHVDDVELLAAARAGDDGAFDALFRRHHKGATAYAAGLAGADQAPDRVAEAFTRIYRVLQEGRGPDRNFRAYLLTSVRHAHVDALRRSGAEVPVEDIATLGDDVAGAAAGFEDRVADRLEAVPIKRVFASLRPSWQRVLWHTVVLGESNEEAARSLGTNANALGVLAFRAREGLRQAYLADHLDHLESSSCRSVAVRLPQFVRGQLTLARRHAVDEHLVGCERCAEATVALEGINARLGALLTPAVALAGASWAGGGGASAQSLLGALATHKVAAATLTVAAAGAVVVGAMLVATPTDTSPFPPDRPGPSGTSTSVAPSTSRPMRPDTSVPAPTTPEVVTTAPEVLSTTVATSPSTAEPAVPLAAAFGVPRVATSGNDQVRLAQVAVLVAPGEATRLVARSVGSADLSVSSEGLRCGVAAVQDAVAEVICSVREDAPERFAVIVDLRFADPASAVRGSLVLSDGARAATSFEASP